MEFFSGFGLALKRFRLERATMLEEDFEETFMHAKESITHSLLHLIASPSSLNSKFPLPSSSLPKIKYIREICS